MAKSQLQTADEVIDALGGTAATARLTGRSDQHVSNWRAYGKLPAKTFLVLSKELERVGKSAPPKVWGITQPTEAAS